MCPRRLTQPAHVDLEHAACSIFVWSTRANALVEGESESERKRGSQHASLPLPFKARKAVRLILTPWCFKQLTLSRSQYVVLARSLSDAWLVVVCPSSGESCAGIVDTEEMLFRAWSAFSGVFLYNLVICSWSWSDILVWKYAGSKTACLSPRCL